MPQQCGTWDWKTPQPQGHSASTPNLSSLPVGPHTCNFWTSSNSLRLVKSYQEVQKAVMVLQPMWYKRTLSVGQVE